LRSEPAEVLDYDKRSSRKTGQAPSQEKRRRMEHMALRRQNERGKGASEMPRAPTKD